MAAGLFGYLGYDMVRLMERLPPTKPDRSACPTRILMRPTIMVVFDSVRDEITVVTPVRPQPGVTRRQAHRARRRAAHRRSSTASTAPTPKLAEPVDLDALHAVRPPTPAEADYLAMVERAKEYIRAGDIFQVVLSQRFTAPFQLPPFALYRALRRINPSPFLCLPRLRRLLGRLLEPGDPGARCATARSRSVRSPAPGPRGATQGARTTRWRTSCSPIRRSSPST